MSNRKKAIILGIDAMDAGITERLMKEGRLPNFQRLKNEGYFAPLATSNPSESIVAWTSFITGRDSGTHGIFDFVMRKSEDYSLYLAFTDTPPLLGRKEIKPLRKGKAFWQVLSEHHVPSYIYFCPNTFPPEKIEGAMVSGMGVPDILGMSGKFSFYTTKPATSEDKDSRGRIVPVKVIDSAVSTFLYGPKISEKGRIRETQLSLDMKLDASKEDVFIRIQDNDFTLKKGQWSTWKKIAFSLGPFKKAQGIIRFYLKSASPDFELYVSPINFDPEEPIFPISYPASFSRALAKKYGLFYTQGMPHDTWALSEGRIDEKAFLEHTDMILEERLKMLKEELKSFKKGLFFFYLETLDSVQHMFWRYIDAKSPLYEAGSPYATTIEHYYEKMDVVVGEVLGNIDENTTLIVLSDHGFNAFRRSAHLNSWLRDNGYLVLKAGRSEGRELLEDVDWSKTRAYALGFGGIYLNRAGREGHGIVASSDAEALKKEIREKLKEWADPLTADAVIRDIYFSQDILYGPSQGDGPDLVVGFNAGYRASWQTALGAAPEGLLEDNKKKWSGDHLMDPHLVPGVIFFNKRTSAGPSLITDVATWILNLFCLAEA